MGARGQHGMAEPPGRPVGPGLAAPRARAARARAACERSGARPGGRYAPAVACRHRRAPRAPHARAGALLPHRRAPRPTLVVRLRPDFLQSKWAFRMGRSLRPEGLLPAQLIRPTCTPWRLGV